MAHKVKSDLQTDGKVSVNTTDSNATLDVNGAGNFSGGTVVSGVDTKTNVGVAIAKGSFLQSNDGNYVRQLIGHTSAGNIEIGQTGTGLISDIRLKPGTTGNIIFEGSGSEDARFDSNGNLGIGTSSPAHELDIYEAGNASVQVYGTNEAQAFFRGQTTYANFSTYSDTFRMGAGTSYNAATSQFVLKNDGNVGVGTTSPSEKLHVSGNVRATGNFIGSNAYWSSTFGNRGTNEGIQFEARDTALQTARVDADAFRFNFGGTGASGEAMRLEETGELKLAQYGSGSITGTATKMLAVDASGNVVEETLPSGGGIDGAGVAGAMTKWTDADSIEDSDYMTESGTGVQIGTDALTYVHSTKRIGISTSSPSVAFDCAGAAKFQSSFYDGSNNLAGDGQVLTGTAIGETLWRDPKDLAFKVMKTYYINVTGGSSGTFYLQHHGDDVTFSLNYESLFPVPSAGTLEKVSIVSSANYNGTTWSLVNASGGTIWTSGSINLTGNTTYQLTPSSASISATDRVAFKVVRGTAPLTQKIALTAVFAFE